MLLGSDDNENKLRGAGDPEPKEAPSGYGDTKLFDSSNNNQQSEDGDLVKDSFMLSMKANDPESVSEKLSTAAAEAATAPSTPDLFGDDDELSNFELDSSISAFKPLGDNVPSFAGSSTDTGASNTFAAPKKEEPAKEEAKKENTPLFTDDDPDFKAFAENTNTDPFKAGEELDFAMSSNAKESDFNTAPAAPEAPVAPAPAPAPEAKNDPLDDLELDEEALAISPFKPKGDVAPAPAPVKEEPKKAEEPAKKDEPAATAAPSPAPEAAKEPAPEEKKPNMQTYGNVKSGVNAFGKKEDKKEEKKPEPHKAAPAAKPAHRSPFAAGGNTPAPAPANQQPIGSGRPGAPTAATTDPAKFRPIPQQQRPQPVVKKSPAPAQRPAASAPQNAVVNQRPGMSDASKKEPSPFQAPSSRPSAAQQPKPAPHVQQPISPVTTVNQNKKRGKGGLVIVIVAALALLIVILGIENWDKLFGGNTVVSPDNTRDTAVTTTEEETTTTSEETTTTTTEETTTTVEETTEETTEPTEETTVETTEETTEATTEATTAATTAETTASTTAAATGTASYRYSIANPHSNGASFSFDLVITNTGNADSSFAGSVQSLDITFTVEPSEIDITGISSDYYTFTQDANDPCTFHDTPTSGTVPAGGELSTTITCTTSEPVQHFYITNYHFELR